MSYRVDPASEVPPSRQLVAAVLDAIASGALTAGAKLLSVRALAAEALVNPNTVAKAYRELETMGVVVARNGRGVFVSDAGPGLAVAARRKKTLAALERAVHEARRAGHDEETLLRALGVREESKA